jgi:hypothetical protein
MSQPRMKGPEIIAETRWLLEARVHPLMIAQVLGLSMVAMARMFHRYGETDLAFRFDQVYPVAA